MLREPLQQMYDLIREQYLSCRDRSLRVTLADGTRCYIEYVSDELKKCRVYGTDLTKANERFARYRTVDTVYNNIPVDTLCDMFDDMPENKTVVGKEIAII